MGSLRTLATLGAAALAASPALAAEITQVSSSGEADSLFGLRIDARFERSQQHAKISREFGDNGGAAGIGAVSDEAELTFSRVTTRVVPAIHVGLWHDLELRAEMPYVISDDSTWRYDTASGLPIDQLPTSQGSSIAGNGLTPDGTACATSPCPMFPVGRTFYAGGAFDDLKVGLAWAVLNNLKDRFVPTWVLSLDVTVPTASRYDPAAGRSTAASFLDAPAFGAAKRAAVGRRIWAWDLATALSQRIGPVEPYFKAHLRIPQRSSSTYDNCVHATELAAIGQMSSRAAALCASGAPAVTQASPPMVWGAIFGAELVPWEDRFTTQRFAVDLRLAADVTGAGRWYNELTPATGKLLATGAYLTASAHLGLQLRASRHIAFGLEGSWSYDTPHLLTGEGMGHVTNEVVTPPANPNFDYRWDLAGRRFRISESTVLAFAASAAVAF